MIPVWGLNNKAGGKGRMQVRYDEHLLGRGHFRWKEHLKADEQERVWFCLGRMESPYGLELLELKNKARNDKR